MKLLLIVLTVLVSFAASAETFWVEENNSSEPSQVRGDPRQVEALYWKIKLFREGQSTSGNDQWGIIMEKSYDACIQRLKEAQENELAALNSVKSARKSSWTYFNPMGPIAVIRSSDTMTRLGQLVIKDRWQDADNFAKSIAAMYQGFKNAARALQQAKANDPQLQTSESPLGKRFRSFSETVEYTWRSLLKRSDENTEAIRSWGDIMAISHEDFLGLIASIENFNRALEKNITSFQSAMGTNRSSRSSGSSSSSATTFRWNDAPFVVTQNLEISSSNLVLELGYEHRVPSSSYAYRFVVNIKNLQRFDSPMRFRDDQGQPFFAVKVQCRTVDERCMDRYRVSTGSLPISQWGASTKGYPSDTLTIYFRTEAELEAFSAKVPLRQ